MTIIIFYNRNVGYAFSKSGTKQFVLTPKVRLALVRLLVKVRFQSRYYVLEKQFENGTIYHIY